MNDPLSTCALADWALPQLGAAAASALFALTPNQDPRWQTPAADPQVKSCLSLTCKPVLSLPTHQSDLSGGNRKACFIFHHAGLCRWQSNAAQTLSNRPDQRFNSQKCHGLNRQTVPRAENITAPNTSTCPAPELYVATDTLIRLRLLKESNKSKHRNTLNKTGCLLASEESVGALGGFHFEIKTASHAWFQITEDASITVLTDNVTYKSWLYGPFKWGNENRKHHYCFNHHLRVISIMYIRGDIHSVHQNAHKGITWII